jgi:integrase
VVNVRQRANLWSELGAPKSAAVYRDIPLSPVVVNILREWKLACPKLKQRQVDGSETARLWLVFPKGAGHVESHANIVNRGFYAAQRAAGVTAPDPDERDEAGNPIMKPKYGLHALRHFFASWAIEQGFSPKRVQTLLGHSSIQMTFDVYGHLFPNPEDDHARFAAAERTILG